jgi:hypothetical protein
MLYWCGIFGKGLTVHWKGLSVDCGICVMGLGFRSGWPVYSRSNVRCWYRGSLDIMCSMCLCRLGRCSLGLVGCLVRLGLWFLGGCIGFVRSLVFSIVCHRCDR